MGSVAAGIVGVGAGLGGAVLQAKAARDQGDSAYKSGMLNAQYAREEGYAEEARRRMEASQELSREKLVFAKAGVALEGSPLDLLVQNSMQREREALDARLAGLRGYQAERRQGRAIRSASRKQAYAALLSGVAGAAGTGFKLSGGGG